MSEIRKATFKNTKNENKKQEQKAINDFQTKL
jgi:hypothetical protein